MSEITITREDTQLALEIIEEWLAQNTWKRDTIVKDNREIEEAKRIRDTLRAKLLDPSTVDAAMGEMP